MNNQSMIFALDGMLLDKDYGARYIDAIGLNNVLKNSNVFSKCIVTDKPSQYDIKDFKSICIIPKNAGLFDGYPGFDEVKEDQHDFIDQIKALPVNKRPKITMFFNDVNIGLHGDYEYGKDFFSGLSFDCVYAFKSDDEHDAKDIFIDRKYQKHIGKEIYSEWIVAAHLDSILNSANNDDNIFDEESDIDVPENIDSFYYGDYRPGIIESLNKIKYGKGILIGNEQLANETNMQFISEKLPMCVVKKFIRNAKYNLVPYEELKTNRQITARIIEIVAFGPDDLSHIRFDGWDFLKRESSRTKDQAIFDLRKIANESSQEIISAIIQG